MSRPNIVNMELEDLETSCGCDSATEKYINKIEVELARLRETEKRLRETNHSLKDDNANYFSRNLELEQERDQMEARLGHCQRFLASGILYTYDELLRHDADVIDRACSELELRAKEDGYYYTIDPIQMREYANQLRQQAKEVQS